MKQTTAILLWESQLLLGAWPGFGAASHVSMVYVDATHQPASWGLHAGCHDLDGPRVDHQITMMCCSATVHAMPDLQVSQWALLMPLTFLHASGLALRHALSFALCRTGCHAAGCQKSYAFTMMCSVLSCFVADVRDCSMLKAGVAT